MSEYNSKYWGDLSHGLQTLRPELSTSPSSSDKLEYLKSYFDYVLGSMSSEVKDELLDHYIINLEKSIEKDLKKEFILAFGRYNYKFGGAKRIRKIARTYAVSYEKNSSKLNREQFFNWCKPRAIWLFSPLLAFLYTIYLYPGSTLQFVLIVLSVILFIPILIEAYKNGKRKKSLDTRARKVDKYLGIPSELLTTTVYSTCLISSLCSIPFLEPLAFTIYSISLFIISYLCTVIFYYHKTVCSVNMEPLIEQLKVELKGTNKTIAHAG